MKRKFRTLTNKLKKANHNEKNNIWIDSNIVDDFIRAILLDLPCGQYHYNDVVDMIFEHYGSMASYSIKKTHLIGLTAITSDRQSYIDKKAIHATFTHDLEAITIFSKKDCKEYGFNF